MSYSRFLYDDEDEDEDEHSIECYDYLWSLLNFC